MLRPWSKPASSPPSLPPRVFCLLYTCFYPTDLLEKQPYNRAQCTHIYIPIHTASLYFSRLFAFFPSPIFLPHSLLLLPFAPLPPLLLIFSLSFFRALARLSWSRNLPRERAFPALASLDSPPPPPPPQRGSRGRQRPSLSIRGKPSPSSPPPAPLLFILRVSLVQRTGKNLSREIPYTWRRSFVTWNTGWRIFCAAFLSFRSWNANLRSVLDLDRVSIRQFENVSNLFNGSWRRILIVEVVYLKSGRWICFRRRKK